MIPVSGVGPSLRRPTGRLFAAATVALALAALGVAACASNPGTSPVATTSVDLPKSYRFDPPAIAVQVGATVTWTNSDNFTHSVQFDGDPAPGTVIGPGESTTHVFDQPGTYAYVCSFHPRDMSGSVVVTAEPGSETP
jgi:plastocyanin